MSLSMTERIVAFEIIVLTTTKDEWELGWRSDSSYSTVRSSPASAGYFTTNVNTLREYAVAWKQNPFTEFINIHLACFYELYYMNFLL